LGMPGVAEIGYQLPDGTGQTSTILPYSNVNTISIAFDEDVSGVEAAFALVDSSNSPLATTGFTYDHTHHVATWMLAAPLGVNKYLIHLTSTDITDDFGATLDGEWATDSSTFANHSGDGTAGGDFDFYEYSITGDVNDNGGVTSGDVLGIKLSIGGPS